MMKNQGFQSRDRLPFSILLRIINLLFTKLSSNFVLANRCCTSYANDTLMKKSKGRYRDQEHKKEEKEFFLKIPQVSLSRFSINMQSRTRLERNER
ncbi:MAG: hypothetical protein ACW981_15465 [Candidatus Hodarchaeales archaeon]